MRLLWKLLGIHILVIGFVVVLSWLAINTLAAGYFSTLMEKYHISPTSSHQMFVSAVHRYLIWVTLAAIGVAAAASYLLMKRVLAPLAQMALITRRIAYGDFTGKVPIHGEDEIGELAASFNRMAESLQRLEQLRKGMVVDLAHELRTPLTNLQGYLEGLRDGVFPPTQETFRLLHEETLRLVELVEDLLRLAKADAARTHLRPAEGSLSDLLSRALEPFRPQFIRKRIELETQFTKEGNRIRFDPPKLRQAVDNLLQNASQYTPPGGKVKISTSIGAERIKVVFANTGGEIAPTDLPFIFERFYRGEKSRSREHGGAGIGLAIVKELIEAHDGKVGAEIDENETRIWFSLPL